MAWPDQPKETSLQSLRTFCKHKGAGPPFLVSCAAGRWFPPLSPSLSKALFVNKCWLACFWHTFSLCRQKSWTFLSLYFPSLLESFGHARIMFLHCFESRLACLPILLSSRWYMWPKREHIHAYGSPTFISSTYLTIPLWLVRLAYTVSVRYCCGNENARTVAHRDSYGELTNIVGQSMEKKELSSCFQNWVLSPKSPFLTQWAGSVLYFGQ